MRSRANARFVSCPACRADAERYLFHESGARFVQCRSCDVVFVNPPAREVRDYFDVQPPGGATVEDRQHVRKELEDVLRYATEVHCAQRGSAPARVLVAGRLPGEESISSTAHVDALRLTRDETLRLVHEADVSPIVAAVSRRRRAGRAQPAAGGLPTCCGRGHGARGAPAAPCVAGRRLQQHCLARGTHLAAQLGALLSLESRLFQLREPAQHARARRPALPRAVEREHVVHGDPCPRPCPSRHSSRKPRAARGPCRRNRARADGDLRGDLRARRRVGGRASG